MANQNVCNWCGRSHQEAKRLFVGPTIHVCDVCVESMLDITRREDSVLAAQVREEIDQAVHEGFQDIVENLDLGPLQDKYVRLMRVKFKEEPGSPTFQEVFQEFKKGVEAEVPNDDFQTRYDLGIAYHEMGLAEDAFREMLNSLRGALHQKNYDRASETISALIHFHDDAARVIKGIHKVINDSGMV